MSAPHPGQLLTRREVFEFLGIDARKLAALVREGNMPVIRFRSGVLYKPEDIERALCQVREVDK